MSGIKFMGRDPDGKAKAVAVSNGGSLQLSGRTPEYAWFSGEIPPEPTEAFAWGIEFDASSGAITAYGWAGTDWVEV